MKKNEDLFLLIKSLTKSEKRFFKLSASIHKGEKNYLRIFDAIDGQREYDEEELGRLFRHEKFAKHLSYEKNYLHALILRTLRNFFSESSSEARLKELLRSAEILFEKRLYKQCSKILRKAKEIAYKYEKFPAILEVLRWEVELYRATLDLDRLDKELDKISGEETSVIEKYENTSVFFKLATRVLVLNRWESMTRSERDVKNYSAIMSHPVLRSEKRALTYQSKYYFCNLHSNYHLIKGDFKRSLMYCKSQLSLIESHPHQILEKPNTYIATLSNYLLICQYLHKYDDYLEVLEKLKITSRTYRAEHTNSHMLVFIYQLTYYNNTGRFREGAVLVPVIEMEMKQVRKASFNQANEIILWYNIFVAYFGSEDYTKALQWINKILNHANLGLYADIHCFTRILNLILHFELGNTDLLEYLVKSTYRFLYKRKYLYKFESCILDFIRTRLPRANSGKELILMFEDLKRDLTKIIRDPFERRALEYFDIISWLESKISGRPFAEIIRGKADLL